jgi:hypothetical protein
MLPHRCFVCFWRDIRGQKGKTVAQVLLESRPGGLEGSGAGASVTTMFFLQLLEEVLLPGAKDDLVIDLFGACASSASRLRQLKCYNVRR